MSFAYLMESFPDPTKTFVYREVAAMVALGMEPLVLSIREPSGEEQAMMEGAKFAVMYLPAEAALREMIEAERATFSARQRKALSHWRGQRGDSTRVFEALWIGRELRGLGVRHVHAHFAGLAARTAWLVRDLWGIGYSFTGHADDIFSPDEKPITLGMLVRDARFIATETDYSRARLEAEFPAAKGKTYRIFNGIDFDASTDVSGAKALPPRIVCVGRLVEKKGFPTLLAACRELRDRGADFGCDIVGAGPFEQSLRTQIAELGLADCVKLHGAQPQSVVRSILRNANVFALAAQREGDGGSDNLPTVIMEAMAAGLPVVTTRIAGIPEMIDDGETGILTDAGDVPAFANALATLLADPGRAERMGKAGTRRARERFSVTASAALLAELLVRNAPIIPPAAAVRANPELSISPVARFFRKLRI